MTKPRLSLREQMNQKSQKAREHENDFQKKFEAVPKLVQDEYARCITKIKKFIHKSPSRGFEKILYAPGKGSLTDAQIIQLQELLCFQGLNVVQTAPLDWRDKKGPRPIGLQFRYQGGSSKT